MSETRASAAVDDPIIQRPPDPIIQRPPEPVSATDAFWHGVLHSGASTLEGAGQLAAHLGGSMGLASPEYVRRSDEEARAHATEYAASPQVQQHPWAAGTGRMVGDVAVGVPLMAIPGMAPVTALGRLAAGTALGTVTGILQPVTGGPDEQRDFETEKIWQGMLGAAGGVVGAGAGEAVGSVLSRALVRGSGGAGATVTAFRQAVRPASSRAARAMNYNVVTQEDQRILTAIDQVVVNRPRLRLTDEAGNVVTGQLPGSLRQFGEALDQIRGDVFAQYDGLLRQAAAGAGARPIDLRSIAADIRASVRQPATRISSPNVVQQANALATRLDRQGSMTLTEAQDLVQDLNRRTQAFWRNPTRQQVNIATIEADTAARLRQELDQTIRALQGPGYQDLRNTYGAIREVENNVARAVLRDANRVPGAANYIAGIGEIAELGRALFTVNPHALVRGLSIAGGRAYMRWLNNPNRMVRSLFAHRSSVLRQHVGKLMDVAGDLARQAAIPAGTVGGTELGKGRQDTLELSPDQPGQ